MTDWTVIDWFPSLVGPMERCQHAVLVSDIYLTRIRMAMNMVRGSARSSSQPWTHRATLAYAGIPGSFDLSHQRWVDNSVPEG